MRKINKRNGNFKRKVLMSGLVIGMVFSHPIATYAIQNNNISTMTTTTVSVGDVFTTKITNNGVKDLDCKFKILTVASGNTKGSVQIGDGTDSAIDKTTKGKIELPEEVSDMEGNTYTVVSVGYSAFQYCKGITNTGLEKNTTITSLEGNAFGECSSLKETGLATNKTVKNIKHYVFDSCSSLKDTGLGTNTTITSLGTGMFAHCSSLENTGLGTNTTITTLSGSTFQKCYKLEDTGLGTNMKITDLGSGEFESCTSLKNTGLSTNTKVTVLGAYFFAYCSSLEDTGLGTNTTIKQLGAYAFFDCPSLKETGLGKNTSIEEILRCAFWKCKGLEEIVFEREDLPEIEYAVFSDTGVKIYYLPNATNKPTVENTEAAATIEMVLDRINIGKAPTKIEYIEGQKFDLSGLEVKVVYKAENVDKLTKVVGYTDATKDRFTTDKTELNINDKEVNISYLGKTAKQAIKVLKKQVIDVVIKKAPNKVEYKEEEDVDLSGLVLTVTYETGEIEDIVYNAKSKNDFSTDKTQLVKGDDNIVITYAGKAVNQPISVVDKKLIDVVIKKAPNKLEYKEGEEVNLSGLVLILTYDNGKSEDIIYNAKSKNDFSTDKTQLVKGDDNIVIAYAGKAVNQPIKVKEFEEIIENNETDKREVVPINIDETTMPEEEKLIKIVDGKEKNVIKTGDISSIDLYVGTAVVAVSVLLIVTLTNKKRKQKQ